MGYVTTECLKEAASDPKYNCTGGVPVQHSLWYVLFILLDSREGR